MKVFPSVIAIACALSMLTGCKEDKPEVEAAEAVEPVDTVQTVEWYKAHKAERLAMRTKCESNPGELAATPNCINSSRAAAAMIWESTGVGVQIEPLTFERK